MLYIKKTEKRIGQFISILIMVLGFPIMILADFYAEIYHRICFPLCGMKKVKRGGYIKIDRQKLEYLNWFQKISCAYCGYANGLVRYWREVLIRTEEYWCGIMHKKYKDFHEPKHHKKFAKYGDEKDFNRKYKQN